MQGRIITRWVHFKLNSSKNFPGINPLPHCLGHLRLSSIPSTGQHCVSHHGHAYFLNFLLQIEFSYVQFDGSDTPRAQTPFPDLISYLPLAVGRLGYNPHSHTEHNGQGNLVGSTHHGGSATFTGGGGWGPIVFTHESVRCELQATIKLENVINGVTTCRMIYRYTLLL